MTSNRFTQLQPPISTLRKSAIVLLTSIAPLATLAPAAHAQPAPAVSPYYTAGDFMRNVHRYWFAPHAKTFAEQAAALTPAIATLCKASPDTAAKQLAQARDGWKGTALAWDKLSAVQVGPMVQRRSLREIDFAPTRPELIKRAVETAPADATAMESIGTPAKGLPALEWLLWTQANTTPLPGTPACTYAVQVAADIQREAQTLSTAFNELAARKPGDDEASNVPALSELVNQWTGGLERLRWGEMEKPRLSGATGLAGAAPRANGVRTTGTYSRSTSGQTAARWTAQWEALRALGAAPNRAAINPGTGLPSLETYMRGLGRDAPASQLVQSLDKTDKAMRNIAPSNKNAVIAAARSIAEVKKVAEAAVAPAMEVTIGFSDADGD